jgi:hypothetical protein
LKRFERRLTANDEGRAWLKHLTCDDPTNQAATARWKQLFEELVEVKQLLRRASETVPLWEVDWSKLDEVQLACPTEDSPPAATS